MSIKVMCDHIATSEILSNPDGTHPTGLQVFNYSPSGELSKIFEWYESACRKLGVDGHGNPYRAIIGVNRETGNYIREGDEVPDVTT